MFENDFYITILTVLTVVTFMFAIIFLYTFNRTKEKHISIWGLSWGIYGFGLTYQFLFKQVSLTYVLFFQQVIFLLSALLLLAGTYRLLNKNMPRVWMVLFLVNLGWMPVSDFLGLPITISFLPLSFFYSIVAIATGIIFLQKWPIEGIEKNITGIIFIIWGIHKSYNFYLSPGINTTTTYYLLELFLIISLNLFLFFVFLKKSNQNLMQNEEIFRLLTENSRDLVFLYQEKPTLSFKYISPNVFDILGYTQEDFYNDPYLFYNNIHPDDKKLFGFSRTPNLNPKSFITIRYQNKAGEYLWFEEYTTPIYDSDGEPFGVEGRLTNITEKKLYTDQSEKAKQDRQKLLYIISHELKSPLTSIRGNIEAILDDKVPTDESNEKYLINAYDKTRLMERLVDDLFQLSELGNSQFSFNFSMVSFHELFPQILDKLVYDIEQSNHIYQLTIGPRLKDIELIVDIERIEQVLYNLVFNAIKNTPEGGSISITCSLAEDRFLLIRISDTGCGIPKEYHDHIFDIFFKVPKAQVPGTGLGLAIAKEIIAKHNASIWVESEDSKGTTFIIKLPIYNS